MKMSDGEGLRGSNPESGEREDRQERPLPVRRCPRRWNASDTTASHVDQGGGNSEPSNAGLVWFLRCGALFRATHKGFETRVAMKRFEIGVLIHAQVKVGG